MDRISITKNIKHFLVSQELSFHDSVDGVIQVDVPFSRINFQILVTDTAYIIYGNYKKKLDGSKVDGGLDELVRVLNSPLNNGNFYTPDGAFLSYKVYTDVSGSRDHFYQILDNAFNTIVNSYNRNFSIIYTLEAEELPEGVFGDSRPAGPEITERIN